MQCLVWEMASCRFSVLGSTKSWWIDSMIKSNPSSQARRLSAFMYAGVSFSIWRCRISTPSKPRAAAWSITFSMGYFSSVKCQYEYVETPSRIRLPAVAAVGAVSEEGGAHPAPRAAAPAAVSSCRREVFCRMPPMLHRLPPGPLAPAEVYPWIRLRAGRAGRSRTSAPRPCRSPCTPAGRRRARCR